MRTLRRASAVIGIVLVVLFVSFAVARTTRARADAAFIAAANLQTVRLTVDGVDRRALVHLPPAYDGKVALPVVLMFHGNGGTADPINPMEGGAPKMASGSGFNGVPEKAKPPVREMVQAWVKLLGCKEEAESIASTIEGITTIVHTGGRDGTEVVFTTIEGHGHIWPGGKSPLPAFILGKATSRLNANDAVWDFFQAHPKPNP
jgi:poly(3-hydroxybutyrate) depolymerase